VSFANPWMLLGALGALLPLLVHLFDRRRPKPRPFAAIAFVLRSHRRTASRLRLKRLLLYSLRTLLLLAVPLALARPQLSRPGSAQARLSGPAATAVVVDRSLGMRYRVPETLFERARDEAREALSSTLAEEPVTLVPCGPDMETPAAPNFDRARVREAIDRMQPSFGAADLNGCLVLAARALEDSPLPGKRLVVISAFTAASLRLETAPPKVKVGETLVQPEFVLRDVAQGRFLPNHFLFEVKAEPAPQLGTHMVQVTFTARNVSAEAAAEVPATLELSGHAVAKAFLALSPGGTAQKSLTARADSGGALSGAVTLGADALAEDDRRDFVVQVPPELRVLVVDGAPSAVRYRDEAFFYEAALSAPGSPAHPTLRDTEAAWHEKLSDYDVVALLNVPAPTAEEAARLKAFVEGGGGLLLSMGDQVEADSWNQRLGALLPRPLRLVKSAGATGETALRPARLGEVAWEHPLFLPFTDKAREGLLATRFSRYMLVEAGQRSGETAEVLAAFDDGAPALLLARRGRGRVLLFTSTLDRDWSDFAIRTSFLPLVQRTAAYLAGGLEERARLEGHIGQTLLLRPEPSFAVTEVRSPSGGKVPMRPDTGGGLSVGPFAEPGIYRPVDASGAPALPPFAVVLDPAQSDLTRVKPEALAAYFGEEAVRGPAGNAETKVPLWTWLLVAAALCFLFEGTLLRTP
jgi:Aerotolerance regulator N-terminal/von Willebrand factor type A domain